MLRLQLIPLMRTTFPTLVAAVQVSPMTSDSSASITYRPSYEWPPRGEGINAKMTAMQKEIDQLKDIVKGLVSEVEYLRGRRIKVKK